MSLFQDPMIKDYSLPVTSLQHWFPLQTVRDKRADIAALIRDLTAKLNPARSQFPFPDICFAPEDGAGYGGDQGGLADNAGSQISDDREQKEDTLPALPESKALGGADAAARDDVQWERVVAPRFWNLVSRWFGKQEPILRL
jgi:hypothetical protein